MLFFENANYLPKREHETVKDVRLHGDEQGLN